VTGSLLGRKPFNYTAIRTAAIIPVLSEAEPTAVIQDQAESAVIWGKSRPEEIQKTRKASATFATAQSGTATA
jgi:hypothetical protein